MMGINIAVLKNCTRCGETHMDIVFKPMDRPIGICTHWAQCPSTGDPILLSVGHDGNPYRGQDKSTDYLADRVVEKLVQRLKSEAGIGSVDIGF